ncbi:MAG: TonB-dependent receptor [Desulfobacterales bacterium]|nr:TonB-dependent receptor [Desulfobacterales bacterium]
MKKIILLSCLFGIIFTVSEFGFAEETEKETKVIKLGNVVVTATRTEKDVDSAPGSVTVITKEDIAKLNIRSLDEAIKYETGVFVKHTKGLSDSMPSVHLRGLYGPDRTLILLDGIPLNEGYTGAVDWGCISKENVERIEIIRGPASALYGGNAMGGVINIITSTPKKLQANASFGYGSDKTYRYSAYIGDRFMDKLNIGIGFESEETDGYPTSLRTKSIKSGDDTTLTGGYGTVYPTDTKYHDAGDSTWVVGDKGNNPAKRWNVNFKTKYDLTDTGSIAFNLQTGLHEYGCERPNTYLRDENGDPTFSGNVDVGGGQYAKVSPSKYDLGGMGEKKESNYSIAYKETFGSIALNGKVGYQKRDKWYTSATASDYDNAGGTLSDADTYSWFTDVQTNIPLGDKHLLTCGLYFRHDDFDQSAYNLSFYRDEDSKTEKTTITEGNDRFYAVYLQDEWEILDNLTLFTGVRFDYWQAFNGKSGKVGNVEEFKEPDDSAFSPKVAVVFKPVQNTVIKSSIGRAFRAPNIYELYRTWPSTSSSKIYYSNPDLGPETLWNYEIGIDQYFFSRGLKLSATYFHTDIDDLIYSYDKGEDNYTDNAGKAKIDGIELGIHAIPIDWLRLWCNYTYNDTEIKKHDYKPEVEGKKITGTPESTINLGTEITYRWITASIAGQYLGEIWKSELNDDVKNVYSGNSEKYWLWDAKLSVAPIKNVEISFSVENLFDKEYYEYYVGGERTYFGEVSLKW